MEYIEKRNISKREDHNSKPKGSLTKSVSL
jgi:hypothetical protein